MKLGRISLVLLLVAVAFVLPQSSEASWSAVDPGLGFWGISSTVHDGGLIVGGYIPTSRLDGSGWTRQAAGIGFGYPSALGVWQGELIAGGSFSSDFGRDQPNHVGRWDGTAWAPLGAGTDGTVLALTEYQGSLIAGGVFLQADGRIVNHIAQWDGTSWNPIGAGVNGTVAALTVYNGMLIAGGSFTRAGDVSADCIAAWDGNSWHALGSGIRDPNPMVDWGPAVWALAEYQGRLIAGGIFTVAGDEVARNVAQWDGSSWSPLGLGISGGTVLDGAVGSLAAFEDHLYAAGLFESAGISPAANIARWDGREWGRLDRGAGFGVLSMSVYDSSLYVIGAFEEVSGVESRYIARWDNRPRVKPNPPAPQDPTGTPGWGGQVRGLGETASPMAAIISEASSRKSLPRNLGQFGLWTTGRTISFRVDHPLEVSLNVYRPDGSLVQRVVEHRLLGAGKWQFWWDGRDGRGDFQGPGVYFCRMEANGKADAAKIIFVR